jgi:hypothetical protein
MHERFANACVIGESDSVNVVLSRFRDNSGSGVLNLGSIAGSGFLHYLRSPCLLSFRGLQIGATFRLHNPYTFNMQFNSTFAMIFIVIHL